MFKNESVLEKKSYEDAFSPPLIEIINVSNKHSSIFAHNDVAGIGEERKSRLQMLFALHIFSLTRLWQSIIYTMMASSQQSIGIASTCKEGSGFRGLITSHGYKDSL